jgi:hypothetical protein
MQSQLETKTMVKTTVINIRGVDVSKSPNYVYVGRGRGCVWGNPFSHLPDAFGTFKVKSRAQAIQRHKEWVLSEPELVAAIKRDLKGKVLGCWCKPKSCHGDTLAAIANGELG